MDYNEIQRKIVEKMSGDKEMIKSIADLVLDPGECEIAEVQKPNTYYVLTGKLKVDGDSENPIYHYHPVIKDCMINPDSVKNEMVYSESLIELQELIREKRREYIELTKEKNENKVPYKTIDIDSEKTLSEDQLLQLFNHCKESKVYLHVLFAGLLGLRKSEIIGLKYSDINYDDCTIHVQRQLGRDFSRDEEAAEPKTITKNEIHLKTFSSERILPIPDMIFDAVMKERKKYEARRSRRKKSFQDKGYICCSSYGRPRSPSFVYAPFKQALKECGLPDIRFHDLRHSYATMLLKHDFDVKAVSVLLGHANTIITVDTYGDKKKIIEDCVDDILPFIDYVLSDYCIPSNEQKFVGDHSDVEISLDFINELFPGEDYNNEENESETVTFSVDELYSSN